MLRSGRPSSMSTKETTVRDESGNAQVSLVLGRARGRVCGALVACLVLGCTQGPGRVAPATMPLWVRSHNTRPVDVYALCGSRDAQWLGTVGKGGTDAYELPARYSQCADGLMLFLVVQQFGRGYWVGPFRPQRNQALQLVIERYAGLSSANLVYQ